MKKVLHYHKVLEGTETLYIGSAMNDIGNLYYYGEGVEQDYSKALEWFEKAVDAGSQIAIKNADYVRGLLGQ